MELTFQFLPKTEVEYLVLIALYKTDKEKIFPIIHKWIKRYGMPVENTVDQPIEMQYFIRFLYYVRSN